MKVFEMGQLWPISRYYPRICLDILRNIMKNFRIAGNLAEIQTWYIPT
jgi:hypothetical protein